MGKILLGRFTKRKRGGSDDGGRKPQSWLDQWHSEKLGTGSRVQSFRALSRRSVAKSLCSNELKTSRCTFLWLFYQLKLQFVIKSHWLGNYIIFNIVTGILRLHFLSVFPIDHSKRNWRQCLCKILGWQTKSIMVCSGISGVVNSTNRHSAKA